MTIEYLTIEKFQPQDNGAAVNQDTNTDWTLRYNTITLNAPGAGVMAGADNTLKDNCLTLNGQYGFQSSDVNSWGYGLAHRRPVQRHRRGQRDQLQRHL